MSSNKIFPNQTPYTCWQFVNAGYSKSDKKHLENLKNLEYLDHQVKGGWKVSLYKDNEHKGELVVGIRGTHNGGNLAQDVLNQLLPKPLFAKKMQETISAWEKAQGQKISTIVGHSGGGLYATKISPERKDINRVTFNAQKAGRGSNIFNLRTEQDLVSSIFSCSLRYWTVGKGGHGIKNFESHLKKREWQELKELGQENQLKACTAKLAQTSKGVFHAEDIDTAAQDIATRLGKDYQPYRKDIVSVVRSFIVRSQQKVSTFLSNHKEDIEKGLKSTFGAAVKLYKNDVGQIRSHFLENAEKFIAKNIGKFTPKPFRPLFKDVAPGIVSTVEEKAFYAVEQFLKSNQTFKDLRGSLFGMTKEFFHHCKGEAEKILQNPKAMEHALGLVVNSFYEEYGKDIDKVKTRIEHETKKLFHKPLEKITPKFLQKYLPEVETFIVELIEKQAGRVVASLFSSLADKSLAENRTVRGNFFTAASALIRKGYDDNFQPFTLDAVVEDVMSLLLDKAGDQPQPIQNFLKDLKDKPIGECARNFMGEVIAKDVIQEAGKQSKMGAQKSGKPGTEAPGTAPMDIERGLMQLEKIVKGSLDFQNMQEALRDEAKKIGLQFDQNSEQLNKLHTQAYILSPFMAMLPNHYRPTLLNGKKLSKQFMADANRARTILEKLRVNRTNIGEDASFLTELGESINNYYQKKIKRQGRNFSVANWYMAVQEVAAWALHPAVGSVVSAGAAAGRNAMNSATGRLGDRWKKNIGHVESARGTNLERDFHNAQRMNATYMFLRDIRGQIAALSGYIDPNTESEQRKEALEDIRGQINDGDDTRADIAIKKAEIDVEILALKDKEERKGKLGKSDASKLAQYDQEAKDYQDKLDAQDDYLKDLKKEENRLDEENQNFEKYEKPALQIAWDAGEREVSWWSQQNQATQKAYNVYMEKRNLNRIPAQEFWKAFHHFSQAVGSPELQDAANSAMNLYEVWDKSLYLKDFALPRLSGIWEKDGIKGVFDDLFSHAGLTAYFTPFVMALSCGIGAIRSLRALFTGKRPKTELQVMLKEMQKMMNSLNKAMDHHFSHLHGYLEGQHEALRKEFSQLRSELRVQTEFLFNEIKKTEARVLSKIDESSYKSLLAKVQLSASRELNTLKNAAINYESTSEKGLKRKFNAYLKSSQLFLETTSRGAYNGISNEGTYLLNTSQFIESTPEQFTGYLSQRLGQKRGVSNAAMWIQGSTELCNRLEDLTRNPPQKRATNYLQFRVDHSQLLIRTLKLFEKHGRHLAKLHTLIYTSVEKAQTELGKNYERIKASIELYNKNYKLTLLKDIKKAWEKLPSHCLGYYGDWKYRLHNFIQLGSLTNGDGIKKTLNSVDNKFKTLSMGKFLGFFIAPAITNGWNLIRYKLSSASTQDREAFAKIQTAISKRLRSLNDAFAFSTLDLPSHIRDRYKKWSSIGLFHHLVRVVYTASVYADTNKSVGSNEKFAYELKGHSKPFALNLRDSSLDTNPSTLEIGKSTVKDKALVNTALKVKVTFDLWSMEQKAQIVGDNSIFKAENFKNCQYIKPEKRTAEDKAITGIWPNYEAFILHYMNGKDDPLSAGNPFETMRKTSTVICSYSSWEDVPVIFPNKWLEAREKQIDPMIQDLKVTGADLLKPQFHFSEDKDKKRWDLKLYYTSSQGICHKFPVASFDEATYFAFGYAERYQGKESTVHFKQVLPKKNEFYRQVMYAGLSKDLGIPGKGTHAIYPRDGNPPLITPMMQDFMGLWHLLEKYPGYALHFDSSRYDGTEATLKEMLVPCNAELGDGWVATMKKIHTQKDKDKKTLQAYLDAYYDLTALGRWTALRPKETPKNGPQRLEKYGLHTLLQSFLSLPKPKIDTLYDMAPRHSDRAFTVFARKLFVDDVLCQPEYKSEHRKNVGALLKRLRRVRSKIEGSKEVYAYVAKE